MPRYIIAMNLKAQQMDSQLSMGICMQDSHLPWNHRSILSSESTGRHPFSISMHLPLTHMP